MDISKGYRAERLSEDNLNYLIKLYKACFNLSITIELLRLKYKTSYWNVQYTGFLAFSLDCNEVAAYYGVFPILGDYKNESYLIAQSGDTMTHPNHQGKGLFVSLARLTFDFCKANGIHFVFGFPNRNSYPGFVNKLNWSHYSEIHNYVIKTGALPVDKMVKKFKFLETYYQKVVLYKLRKRLSKSRFPNSLKMQNPEFGNIIHDDRFYAYKQYTTFHIIEVEGVLCSIKLDGRLWIGDIQYCEEGKFFAVMKQLIKIGKALGCSSLQISVFQNSYYDGLLNKDYKPKYINPVCCLNLSNELDPTLFAYQGFDFDTY